MQYIKKKKDEKKKKSWAGVKSLPANARDMGLIPSLGRSHVPWST